MKYDCEQNIDYSLDKTEPCYYCQVDVDEREYIMGRLYICGNGFLTDTLESDDLEDFKFEYCPKCGRKL